MPVLWSPVWATPPGFRVERGYTDMFVVGWQDGFIVQAGNPTILQEYPYGGYRFYLKFYDDFWNNPKGSWDLVTIFEDVYAMPPGSSTPINTGTITVAWRWYLSPYYRSGLVLDMPALDNHYYWQEFPPTPPDYWQKNLTPIPPTPFITNPP